MTRTLLCLLFASAVGLAQSTQEDLELTLFSDFQCYYCGQMAQPIRELEAKGVDGVRARIHFKNFPLGFHADAPLAAQAAQAAGQQGKFWEMHDLLFANQKALKREDLLAYAEKLQLDMARFRKDLDSEKFKAVVAADLAEGQKLGVEGTPTFFINGKSYSGKRTYDELKELLVGEKRRARALAEIGPVLMSKGPAAAPVTVELFADLTSPVTRPAMAAVEELMRKYPAKVRLQFRNFPLAFHPQAGLAHEAAMDAAKQGRFWEFAGYLLDHQDAVREQDLIAFGGSLGLDEKAFAEMIQQRRYTPRVEADLMEGLKRGIRGSPVVFVNDTRIDGVPSMAALMQSVESALSTQQAKK